VLIGRGASRHRGIEASRHQGIKASRHQGIKQRKGIRKEEEEGYPQITQIRADYLRGILEEGIEASRKGRGEEKTSADYADCADIEEENGGSGLGYLIICCYLGATPSPTPPCSPQREGGKKRGRVLFECFVEYLWFGSTGGWGSANPQAVSRCARFFWWVWFEVGEERG